MTKRQDVETHLAELRSVDALTFHLLHGHGSRFYPTFAANGRQVIQALRREHEALHFPDENTVVQP